MPTFLLDFFFLDIIQQKGLTGDVDSTSLPALSSSARTLPQAIRRELKMGGGGGGSGGGVAGAEWALAKGAAVEGWTRHGMDLDGLGTLWEIVLNATGN